MHRGWARPPCSSTARTSRSPAIRSAASSVLPSWTPSGRCSLRRRARPRGCRTGWRRCGSSRRWRGCSGSRRLHSWTPRTLRTPATVPARKGRTRLWRVLLSDVDLRKELEAGRLVLNPWDPAMLQPSSVDVRLDRFFRVFQNHRYTHIDPAEQQDELTSLVQTDGEEPFVLHPGEFVLGSTFESVGL